MICMTVFECLHYRATPFGTTQKAAPQASNTWLKMQECVAQRGKKHADKEPGWCSPAAEHHKLIALFFIPS